MAATDDDDDDGPGVPQWVVTYGDMMSLLLTFFIMLVALSEVVQEQKYRAILDSLHRFIGFQQGPPAPPGHNYPLNSLIASLETLGSFTNEDSGRGGVKRKSPEGREMRVFRTREGDPQKVGDSLIFGPGESVLSQEVRAKLVKIAAELAGKPNKIEIRSHASPDPVPPEAEVDQYMLTYQRGWAVLRFLERQGISSERLRITAAADTEPLPDTGDTRSRQLDRVEILILDEFARGFVGPRAMSE